MNFSVLKFVFCIDMVATGIISLRFNQFFIPKASHRNRFHQGFLQINRPKKLTICLVAKYLKHSIWITDGIVYF